MAGSRFEFLSKPGVRRDGTELDSPFYADGEWVRWQRGKPRKIGGYRAMSRLATGPVRTTFLDSRNGENTAHFFSPWGIQRQVFDNTGSAGTLADRTPFGFTRNDLYSWSSTAMFSGQGADYAAIIASATPDIGDISNETTGPIYYGDIGTDDPMVALTNASVDLVTSGGVCVLQPFLVIYGSNGELHNSNANDFSDTTGWAKGGANFSNLANVAATKFVYGAPTRGGSQSPAGLFWAQDALVRMTFTGDARLWDYDTLTQPTSIMSKRCVVELDGKFYWPGTDRFLQYNGVIQELENNMNQNWFFDNLNYTHRNKVWGTKVTRYGEIWWFYPRGSDTECNDAIIFNYREGTWYDAVKARSAGDCVQTYQFPVWVGAEDARDTLLLEIGLRLQTSATTADPSAVLTFADTTGVEDGMVVTGAAGIPYGALVLSHTGTTVTLDLATTEDVLIDTPITFTTMTTAFVIGSPITGATSGATGTVARVTELGINVVDWTGDFQNLETLDGNNGATAQLRSAQQEQQLDTVYQQEFLYDKIVGPAPTAIRSSFTTSNFGYATGDPNNPFMPAVQTQDVMTLAGRLEPDFNATGALTATLEGRSYPVDAMRVLETLEMEDTTPYVDFKEQERILRVKIESNAIGGFYEQGSVMIELEPGDERSSTAT